MVLNINSTLLVSWKLEHRSIHFHVCHVSSLFMWEHKFFPRPFTVCDRHKQNNLLFQFWHSATSEDSFKNIYSHWLLTKWEQKSILQDIISISNWDCKSFFKKSESDECKKKVWRNIGTFPANCNEFKSKLIRTLTRLWMEKNCSGALF